LKWPEYWKVGFKFIKLDDKTGDCFVQVEQFYGGGKNVSSSALINFEMTLQLVKWDSCLLLAKMLSIQNPKKPRKVTIASWSLGLGEAALCHSEAKIIIEYAVPLPLPSSYCKILSPSPPQMTSAQVTDSVWNQKLYHMNILNAVLFCCLNVWYKPLDVL
jgi:hypothetical protein